MLCQLLQIEEKQPKWWRWLVALWRGPSCKTMPSIAVIVTDQRNKKLNALLLSFQFELSRVPFRWAEFGWWINWNKIEWEFVWYGWWKVLAFFAGALLEKQIVFVCSNLVCLVPQIMLVMILWILLIFSTQFLYWC